MSSDTQLDRPQETKYIPLDSGDVKENDRFTGLGVNLVVLVLVAFAYLPLFLDPTFYTIALLRQIALIGLGLLYLFNGTYGMIIHERHLQIASSSIIYFTLQITITLSLLYLSQDLNSGLWLLILPVAAQSLALFSWYLTILISGVLLVGIWLIFLRGQSFSDTLFDLLGIGSSLAFTLIFTYIAVRESVTRQKIEHLAVNLRQANHRLAEYAAQVEELATTKERNRLAREIHDNLGHYLTVINVQIEAARTVMENHPEKAHDALAKAQKLTQDGLASVRQSVGALRESPMADKTLAEAIHSLIEAARLGGLQSDLRIIGVERPLDSKIALTLYRVAQEGLTNVRKHARAKTATVILDFSAEKEIDLTVKDDGIGAENIDDAGFGLIGTAERVQLLGGHMEIETAPDAGLTLMVTIPTPAA